MVCADVVMWLEIDKWINGYLTWIGGPWWTDQTDQMDEWMDGRTDAQTDGWMGGWIHE